jgi:orotidine-5'-phosphate decarboxylase
VVALDVDDREAALRIAAQLQGNADLLKVGLELYLSAGRKIVEDLVETGWRVFLDLKFHDIPATVTGAVRAARGLGAEMMTLHASGGAAMLEAAVAARAGDSLPRLFGVTVLTSLDASDLIRMGQAGEPREIAGRLARMARDSGCDGVVASAREVGFIKETCGAEFLVITPGIRPSGGGLDDQARVATVEGAVAGGSDFLVVGRPILRASEPAAAAAEIREQIRKAYDAR